MSAHDIDVSWDELRQIVRDWAGASAELEEVKSLDGGSVSTTLCLCARDGQKAVMKVTPHRVDRSYADEAHQLKLMRQIGLPVPQVYDCHIGTLDRPVSYLLMEFVEGVDLGKAKHACPPEAFDRLQAELAGLVLRMHAHTGEQYMRVSEHGLPRFDDWAAFYRSVYDPIWHEVEKANVLPVKCRRTVGKVHERLGRLLAHDDRPRLVHWDIWASNVLARPDAGGAAGDSRWRVAALLDPYCKFAHVEAELAYMELFHTATPAFLKAYQSERKLPAEYHRVRRPVYQLYTLLNHLRLFGPHEYLKLTVSAIERVAPLV